MENHSALPRVLPWPMRALHEPPGEGTGPTGCRPGPPTRRFWFMVPRRAEKRMGDLHEPAIGSRRSFVATTVAARPKSLAAGIDQHTQPVHKALWPDAHHPPK